MHFEIWSWLLSIVGAAGIYLAGKRDWRGWAVSLASEVLWTTYGITTKQYGFVFGSALYGTIFIKNLRAWIISHQYGRIRKLLTDRDVRRKRRR